MQYLLIPTFFALLAVALGALPLAFMVMALSVPVPQVAEWTAGIAVGGAMVGAVAAVLER